jgi:hypothetical protein
LFVVSSTIRVESGRRSSIPRAGGYGRRSLDTSSDLVNAEWLDWDNNRRPNDTFPLAANSYRYRSLSARPSSVPLEAPSYLSSARGS